MSTAGPSSSDSSVGGVGGHAKATVIDEGLPPLSANAMEPQRVASIRSARLTRAVSMVFCAAAVVGRRS